MTISLGSTTLLLAAVQPMTILAQGFLVGSIPATLNQGGLNSAAGERTILALGLVAAIFVFELVLRGIDGVLARALGMALDRTLEERVMKSLGGPPGLAHLEDPGIANRIALLQGVGTAGQRPGNAVSGLFNRVQIWLSGLGSAILLAGFRWWVAVGLSAVYLWAARVTLRDYITLMKISTGQAPTLRRSYYYRDLAFIPPSAKEVRVFGLGDWLVDRFRTFWLEAIGPLWKERGNRRELGLASIAMSLASIAAAAYAGFSAIEGEFGIGPLTVFLGAIAGLYAFGMGYGPGDIQLQYGLAALSVIDEFEEPSVELHPVTGSLPAETAPVTSIRFEGVRFTYPGGDREVLSGIDLEIPAGKSTAIVGLNGAGKTTLVKLLCRFYEPTGGQVLLDGADLAKLNPQLWQRRLAAIFQDFIKYELSARENIEFGYPDLAGDESKLANAVSRAGASALVESLPRGFDTDLSREVTGGTQISGGEWQRIALARALFAVEGGARVLILDEPTANLDVRAEAELYRSFLEVTHGLTTILVSHRFSTVRRVDLIYVIENGVVIERGTHDELIALSGRYAHMFNLQASRFVQEAGQGGSGGIAAPQGTDSERQKLRSPRDSQEDSR